MSRLFIFVTILLRCVYSSNVNINVIEDDYNQQSVLVDKNKYPDSIAKKIAYYPNPNDDGTFLEAFMGTEDDLDDLADILDPEYPSAAHGASIFFSDKPRYYLYTKENRNNPVELYISKDNIEGRRHLNKDAPVKIICHGYRSSYKNGFPVRLMNKYLDSINDVNVILVDWEDLAGNWWYEKSAKNTMTVGQQISLLIKRLVKDGFTDFSKIHFIGHSLGAHVGGSVGYYLSMDSDTKIFRVTGLDPAGPSFCSGKIKRLSPVDATFVDIIHTAVGADCEEDPTGLIGAVFSQTFGLNMSIGNSDFYPNGGTNQPGCNFPESTSISCSHSRSYHLLEESIETEIGFHACKCENWSNYQNGECICKDTVLMGENCPLNSKGNYFLKTGPKHPFAHVG